MRLRTIEAVSQVVFARPHELYGNARQALGNFHRGRDVIAGHAGTPAEAATEHAGFDADLVRAYAGHTRGGHLVESLALRAQPQLHTFGRDHGGAVERLHGGMRQVRESVVRFHALRGRGCGLGEIAFRTRYLARLLRQFAVVLGKRHGGEAGVLLDQHFGLQCVSALLGGPGIAGHHGDALGNFEHVGDTRHGAGGREVGTGEAAAARWAGQLRIALAGATNIDAIAGFAA